MLKVSALSRVFYDPQRGEFPAVDNISFEARAGEVFGLLGPNGAGKTTTLRMVAAILKPTCGTITLNDEPLTTSSQEIRKQIGFLSSTTGLYERLTPREILVYFARLFKYPRHKVAARTREIIESFQMSEFADTRCEKLSTGMLQRVSIARAAVHDPQLLILDEPTSGLDVIAKQSIHEFILQCRAQQKIILFSTHLMNEAEKLCDRIGILHRGTLFAVGTLFELREKTQKHYLEDIFLSIVKEGALEAL
jgi:sodium transport system ATP-binding protein